MLVWFNRHCTAVSGDRISLPAVLQTLFVKGTEVPLITCPLRTPKAGVEVCSTSVMQVIILKMDEQMDRAVSRSVVESVKPRSPRPILQA